jgi:hypothetical protein
MQTMNAKHLTVRNLPPELASALEQARQESGKSLNSTVISVLERGLGVATRRSNGLAKLAGGWTKADAEEFERNTASFSDIDPEIWR